MTVRFLVNLLKALTIVGLLLLVINLAITPEQTPPAPTDVVTITGVVTDVSPGWTDHDGGNITVGGSGTLSIGNTHVVIVGSTSSWHQKTVLNLKNRFVVKLIGKRVKIIGTKIVEGADAIIAKVIEELP